LIKLIKSSQNVEKVNKI